MAVKHRWRGIDFTNRAQGTLQEKAIASPLHNAIKGEIKISKYKLNEEKPSAEEEKTFEHCLKGAGGFKPCPDKAKLDNVQK